MNQNFLKTACNLGVVSGTCLDQKINEFQKLNRTVYIKAGVDPEIHIKKRLSRYCDKPTRRFTSFEDFKDESESNGPVSDFGSGRCLFVNEVTGSVFVFMESAAEQLMRAET